MAVPFDIHIQIVPPDQYKGMAFYSFAFQRSLGVRGLQKLVNMYAKYLLTPEGTDPLDRSYGTNLTGLLGSNVGLYDAKDVLELAVNKTTQALYGMQVNRDVPDTERLAAATVTEVLLVAEWPGIAAQIYIENTAGQGRAVLLPTLVVRS